MCECAGTIGKGGTEDHSPVSESCANSVDAPKQRITKIKQAETRRRPFVVLSNSLLKTKPDLNNRAFLIRQRDGRSKKRRNGMS